MVCLVIFMEHYVRKIDNFRFLIDTSAVQNALSMIIIDCVLY